MHVPTTDIKTLVVDDSEFFAEMTATTLSENNQIAAQWVQSAEDALRELEDGNVDCIVSDYDMPGRNGLELLSIVKQRYDEIPFILLTGRGDEEVASEAISAGVSDYLLKLEVIEDEQYNRLAKRIRNVVMHEQAQEMYELLVENSPDTIAQISADGRILSANPAMADLLDSSRETIIGNSLSEVFPDAIGEDRLSAGQEAVETGRTVRTEDGYNDQYFHNMFVPVTARNSEVTFQMISRDITERKQREEAIERQNERLDRFAGVVSHDLRNPLGVAQSSLELLDEDNEHVDRLDRSLGRIEQMIDELLTLARDGETVDETRPTTLDTVASDAWDVIDAEATLTIEETDRRLLADTSRLQELLANLFRNSIDHGEATEDLEITVGLCPDGFYVADNGTGIPKHERTEVFEPGYSNTPAGTGLGLSIVDEIARAHGWEVTIADSNDGGARIEVTGVEFQTA